MANKKNNPRQNTLQVKSIASVFKNYGYSVRRENLSRGHSFKVKSGGCLLAGEKLIFVDKRLPFDNQISLLVDYVKELNLNLSEEELSHFPETARAVLSSTHQVI